jgi:RNA polymerase sigma-70 factor (ECF subfamily)
MSERRASNGSGSGTPPTATSRSLLDRARADDPTAWERLVALYAPLVLAWARRGGLRDQDAADVCQEVFGAVAAHLGRFRKERPGDTFRGWLRRITRSKVADHFRRQGRDAAAGGSEAQRRLAQLPEPPPHDDEADGGAAEAGLVGRALELVRSCFEDRTWQAFVRTAVEGRSPKEVAGELGMSPGAVRVAKSRVLHRLREELGDLLE